MLVERAIENRNVISDDERFTIKWDSYGFGNLNSEDLFTYLNNIPEEGSENFEIRLYPSGEILIDKKVYKPCYLLEYLIPAFTGKVVGKFTTILLFVNKRIKSNMISDLARSCYKFRLKLLKIRVSYIEKDNEYLSYYFNIRQRSE